MRLRTTATLLVVPLTLLAACGDTAKSVDRSAPGDLTPSSAGGSCQSAIPDSVLKTLGWAPADAATSMSGTCVRTTADGMVSLMRDSRAGSASTTYRAACVSLQLGGGSSGAVDWLAGSQGCATTKAVGSGTVLHLVALTPHHKVLHVEVDANSPVAPDAVDKAAAQLVASGDEVL